MAKKFVRGVTGVDDIEKFDKTLTNINDIISDGQNTYVHTKKGKNELYYKITDGVTTVQSTGNTITVEKSDDGTVNLNTNPRKVLEHDNLISNSEYVTVEHEENSNASVIKTDKLDSELNILGLRNYVLASATPKSTSEGILYDLSSAYDNVPDGEPLIIEFDWSVTNPTATSKFRINRVISFSDKTSSTGTSSTWQNLTPEDVATVESSGHYYGTFMNIIDYDTTAVVSRYLHLYQPVSSGTVTISNLSIRRGYLKSDWVSAPEDTYNLITQKQNTITNNISIGVSGSGLRQLYTQKQTYTVTGGLLKTHVKSVSPNTSVSIAEEEFNFIAKIDKGVASVNFTLNDHDKTKFTNIMNTYGQNNTVRISGFVFTLSGATLTVSATNNANQNYVITFSDII